MKLDPAEIIARRADEAREHLARDYGLICLNCDEMLAIESAFASKGTPDHPAENAKSSGEVRADALNRYFHEAADAQEEADLLRAALENLADAADVVMGREVFEPTRWPEWIDLANASLAARAALARSGKGEG